MTPRWLVTIPYREPLFVLRTPGAPDEYVIAYQVAADSAEEARGVALVRFHELAHESSVRWAREPIDERIVVRPA